MRHRWLGEAVAAARRPRPVLGLFLERSSKETRAGEGTRGSLLKRLFDVVIGVSLLIALAPLMAMLAIAIKLESKGPIFHRCRRVGLRGRTFAMLKFRKMRHDAAGSALTGAGDERFTRIGSFLARTKFDELPQLWNVIRGEMSLVGPRPEDASFVAFYPHCYAEILQAKPGITGLTQLAFAGEGRLLDAADDPTKRYVECLLPQKIAIDQLYVGHRSTRMDLRILFWTVVVPLGIEVSVNRRTGRMSIRRRAHLGAATPVHDVGTTSSEPESVSP